MSNVQRRFVIIDRSIPGTSLKRSVCVNCRHYSCAVMNIDALKRGDWWCDLYCGNVGKDVPVDRACPLVTEHMVSQ